MSKKSQNFWQPREPWVVPGTAIKRRRCCKQSRAWVAILPVSTDSRWAKRPWVVMLERFAGRLGWLTNLPEPYRNLKGITNPHESFEVTVR